MILEFSYGNVLNDIVVTVIYKKCQIPSELKMFVVLDLLCRFAIESLQKSLYIFS